MIPLDTLLDAYAQLGIDVYLDTDDVVRVRAARGLPESVKAGLVDAVLCKLRHVGTDVVRAHLLDARAAAIERIMTRPRGPSRQEPAA
jgi:hypothetical protein